MTADVTAAPGPVLQLVGEATSRLLELGIAGVVVLVCLWTIRQLLRRYDEVQEKRVQEALKRREREDER